MRFKTLLCSLCCVVFMLSCGSQQMVKVQDIAKSSIKEMANNNDWASWRGKYQNGFIEAENLPETWSLAGENLHWRQDFVGRSTPVVMNGKVFVIGRVGEGQSIQERVAAFDAENGNLLWDKRYNMRNTYVPFNRVGWASMVGDPETNYVFSMGSGGMLHCLDQDGNVIWKRSLIEEFGIRTGYGGRTTNPVVDENRVIVGFVTAGWGDQKPMTHRHIAFDKRTGETIWMSTPGRGFRMPNIYSNPVITVIDGMRLVVVGSATGYVYAIKSRTGEKVWEFELSKRGLNSSVVVDGDMVYAAHGEENIDTPTMGRIVAINGSGSGDIRETNEAWRFDTEVGFASPLLANGRIYYVNSAANMYALDAKTGQKYWEYSLGTVGKSSPVWADGKIYVTETNGKVHILRDNGDSCEQLSLVEIKMPNVDRHAEIYSSPAIAYQRIYFATEEGLYCLGKKDVPFIVTKPQALVISDDGKATADAAITHIQVAPAEILAHGGKEIKLTAKAFDDKGRFIKNVEATWYAPENLGKVDANGNYTATSVKNAAGYITAQVGEVKGTARVRVFTDLPWTEDFENYEVDGNPPYWIGASSARSPGGKYLVADLNGNKVLKKPRAQRGIQRHFIFMGPSDMKEYVMQVDVQTSKDKRRRGDAGLIMNGYVLDLMGKTNRVEIRSWTSENRIREMKDFTFEPETWFTMKMTIDYVGGKAIVKGKVWKTGEAEPAEWTITTEDPYPTLQGAPGIYGVSNAVVYYDNFRVDQKK